MSKTMVIPERLLLGPGPSGVHPRVLSAMTTTMLGHLDPKFVAIMNENQEMLRYVFNTKNSFTLPVSGTGSAAMEAAVVNLLEPEDEMIVFINGYFGERLAEMARRCGANVHEILEKPGKAFKPDQVKQALEKHLNAKAVGIVHAETSTGVHQSLKEIGAMVRESGKFLIVDAVTSLGGMPVDVDENLVDICYSCSQKCLSAPPGLGPITINERALQAIKNRKSPVRSWYLDVTLLTQYWGEERTYHHTAPVSMNYALNAALDIVMEEGLEARYKRHQYVGNLLKENLQNMDFRLFPEEGHQLPMLTVVETPPGIDAEALRVQLLEKYNIEVASGLGELKGKMLRIGLMGYTAEAKHVYYLLNALKEILGRIR